MSAGYRIEILSRGQRLHPRGNVDVVVHFDDGRRLGGTFFTIEAVRELMKRYRTTGECAGGSYFFAKDMVLVEKLTEDAIDRTVADLVATGELESALSAL
jgi:hypothetical protein